MNLEQLRAQQAQGFRLLKFEPALEAAFARNRVQALRDRALPVATSALALFVVYSFLDYFYFPESVWAWTVPIRLFVVCPVIGLVLMLRFTRHTRLFVRLYGFSYLWCGLSLVLIIAIARLRSVPMPYDGILLSLMFGYFLMGLSWRVVCGLSTLIVIAYLVMEWVVGTPHEEIIRHAFFLLTAHSIGMVGSWLHEYSQRAHFLDRCLLHLGRSQAEAESARKGRFVAIASHDLRQPLNVINLLLANLSATVEEKERQRIQDQLDTSVGHLNRLLESLLDMSRLEEGLVHAVMEPVNVNELLQRVQSESRFAPANTLTSVELEITDAPLWMEADPILVRRVLRNLILNAQQHADCSRIILRAFSRDQRVVLEVDDNGRGIDADEQAGLFDAYTKGAVSLSAERGLGLGLAIVAQLTRLMGGDYTLRSDRGAGACFSLRFPASTAPANNPRPQGLSASASHHGRQIWVIEPHPGNRLWLARLLEHWGYRVFAPRSVPLDETLDLALRQNPPEMVITALHLAPDQSDGRDYLYGLREHMPSLPALILTADTQEPTGLDQATQTWLIHKPVTAARLRTVLTRLLASREQPASVSVN